jgi:hypothetical protein
MTTEWEFKYPLVSVRALDRGISDHTPLFLDTNTPAFAGNETKFRLELSWFTLDDFYECVATIWNKPIRGNNAVQRWNNKLSALRHYLRGWVKHKLGVYKQAKVSLQQTIDQLDITAERRDLAPGGEFATIPSTGTASKTAQGRGNQILSMCQSNRCPHRR